MFSILGMSCSPKQALGLNSGRVRKDSSTEFTLLVASAEDQPSAHALHEIEVNGNKVNLNVRYGDFSEALQKSINALAEVWPFPQMTDANLS